MDIKLHTVTIREILDKFEDKGEEGVYGYGGKLNIRPRYQREFIYNDAQQLAVLDTIFKGYPLNVMYWVDNGDGTYELLDGQQRTLSICNFSQGAFHIPINGRFAFFTGLQPDELQQFLDYKLQIYICSDGTEAEKIAWFRTINIASVKLTDQELLNAVYPGTWLTDAKIKFSKKNCAAYKIGDKYLNGSCDRQEYLATVLAWIADAEGIGGNKAIEQYMSSRQTAPNADKEWLYYQQVIAWATMLFPKYRKEMKGQPWGLLYNKYKDNTYSPTELEKRIGELIMDDDVSNNKGIYPYLLSGDERHLSIRAFTDSQKRKMYEAQGGKCARCGSFFALEAMEADHITPWSEGGHTTLENGQMLCKHCNRIKSNK